MIFLSSPHPKPVGVHSPHRTYYLSSWFWRPGDPCISEPHGSETERQFLSATSSKALHSQLQHSQSSCEKSHFTSPGIFSIGRRLQFYHTSKGYSHAFRERRLGRGRHLCTVPWPCYSSPVTPSKEFTHICIWYYLNHKNEKMPGFLNLASYLHLKLYLSE